MADNSVIVQMSAQDAELVAAWQRARKGPQGFGEEVEKAGKKGKKAGQEVKEGMDSAAKSALSVASSITGISSALDIGLKAAQLFKAELDAIVQRQQEAAGFQVGLAEVQRRAFEALPEKSDISIQALSELVKERSRIPQAQQYTAIAAALKEGGEDFSQAAAVETAFAAADFRPFLEQGKRDQLAGAAVALQKQVPGLTPQQAVANVLNLHGKTESDLSQVTESLIPGIGRMQRLAPGSSAGELAALPLAFEGTSDAGLSQATATAEKLLTTLSKAGVTGTLNEQLAKLQADPKLQKAVMQKAGRGSEGYVAIEEFLKGGPASQAFQELSGQLAGSPKDVEARQRKSQAAMEEDSVQKIAAFSRGLDVAKEADLSQYGLASKGMADRTLQLASDIAGPADTQRWMKLRDITRSIASPFTSNENYTSATIGEIRRIQTSVGDPEVREKLDQLADLLAQQLEELRAANHRPKSVVIEKNNDPGRVKTEQPARALNDR